VSVLLSVLFAASAAVVPLAAGQGDEEIRSTDEPAAESPDDAPVFEDSIIVTAQRREQSLQDVPIAISPLTTGEITDRRFRELIDIIDFVPNTDVKDALAGFSQVITIRGVGQNDFGFLNTSSVGVYMDEVSLASPGQFGFMSYDLDRVEVLRGPQGTLYGRNTTGGAVNFHTVRPSQETSGYLTVGLGSFESLELEGAIGGSLGRHWAGRLSGRFEHQGESFHFNRMTDDDFGTTETAAVRGQLTYVRSNVDVNFSVSYLERDGAHVPYEQYGLFDSSSVDAILNDPEQGLPIHVALGASQCSAAAAGRLDNQSCVNVHGYSDTDGDPWIHDSSTENGLNDTEQFSTAVTLNWRFAKALTLTSITGYQTFENRRTEDQSDPLVLFAPRIRDQIDQFSQELRISGSTRTLHWLGGFFYSHDSAHERAEDAMDDFFYTRLHSLDDQDTTAYAAFANADWAFSNRWAANAGLRLTREEREKVAASTDLNPFQASLFLALFQGINPTKSGAVTYASTEDALDHTDTSGRLGLTFRPADDWMLYLTAGTGFKSGGWITGIVFEQHELEPFEPEEILAYEFGFKGSMGSNLILNGALFYYDYDNVQTYLQSSIGFRMSNIDGATNIGGEIELIAQPTRHLALRAGIGYLDTEMSEFMGADGMVPEGNDLPNAPKLDFNGFLRYDVPVSNRLILALQTDFKYRSEMFRDAENDPLTMTDPHFLINGRISVKPKSHRWEIALWGKNLGDEDVVLSGFNVPILGLVTHVVNAPRTYGLSLSWNL